MKETKLFRLTRGGAVCGVVAEGNRITATAPMLRMLKGQPQHLVWIIAKNLGWDIVEVPLTDECHPGTSLGR